MERRAGVSGLGERRVDISGLWIGQLVTVDCRKENWCQWVLERRADVSG